MSLLRLKKNNPGESESARRLNAALDRLLTDFNRFHEDQKISDAPLEKLWLKMNSVEGRSAVYPELLLRLLVMSDTEMLTAAEKLHLIENIPGSIRGCCAVEAYYKFDHDRVAAMPDAVILALATHTGIARTKQEKGFHHGVMIELVDRGLRDSYNGYACVNNKARGCRITAAAE